MCEIIWLVIMFGETCKELIPMLLYLPHIVRAHNGKAPIATYSTYLEQTKLIETRLTFSICEGNVWNI